MKRDRFIAVIMAALVISLTPVFAAELNLTYDANGNLISGDGKYRIYNSLNQLWKVYNGSTNTTLLQEYVYDPIEERVAVKRTYNSSGSTIETVYYYSEEFVRVTNSSGTFDFTYVYHEGQLVAQNNGSTTFFIHGNSEGSSSVVTNSSGSVVERTEYSPYGERLNASSVRFGYEAEEYDSVIGTTDFDFRRYNQNLALFEQPDNIIPNVYDPQRLNRYSMTRNNPLRYTDPTGHYEEDVHRDFTTYLMEHAGFSITDAHTIGDADQAMDDNFFTNPVNPLNVLDGNTRYYHFQTREVALGRLHSAGSLEEFGNAMHTFQDSYSHADYLNNALGHASAGHAPDKTYNDPVKADAMALASYMEGVTRSGNLNPAQAVNVWMAILPSVQAFNRATTTESKNLILSTGHRSGGGGTRGYGGSTSYTNKYGRTTRLCSTCSKK